VSQLAGPCSCGMVLITAGRLQRWHHAAILAQNQDFCLPHLHSTPQLGGSRWNIVMPFGMEKLEWLGYPTVKKFWRYVYSFCQNVWTWLMDTAWRLRPCLHSIAQQKQHLPAYHCSDQLYEPVSAVWPSLMTWSRQHIKPSQFLPKQPCFCLDWSQNWTA